MDPTGWIPHGQALLDFLAGDRQASVLVRGDDGETETVAAEVFFRGPADFSALEEAALDLCRGRVLDVGAGAGCHSLALQERGLWVVAIDAVPGAVEVMRRRGVRDARRADIFGFRGGPFDTLLLLMNGVGIVGSLAGLDRFLGAVEGLLAPDGQILLDSYDPGDAPRPGAPVAGAGDRYPGEMRFALEYRGARGGYYDWLFVDLATLTERAKRTGWACLGIWQEAEGHFLARITRVRTEAG